MNLLSLLVFFLFALAQPYSSAWVQSYAYDAHKRFTNLVSPAGAFGYVYFANPSGLIDKLNLPNGAYIDYSYDLGRLTETTLYNSTNLALNSHAYLYDAFRRKQQTFQEGNFIDYGYDNIGQLITALGKEQGGGTDRAHEQFRWKYDAAGNLEKRTNNLLVQTFTVNALNQLSNATRSGNITVAGFTTTNASVTVNGNAADEYEDLTFARTNLSLAAGNNTFTAVAADGAGRGATNSITVNLPATVSYTYDQNGNLTSDGSRTFAYDDENQLIRVGAADWETHFIYDALMRRRVQLHYQAATNGTTDFVSGATSLSTLIRNDADVWAGTKFTVGSVPLVVTELGRWVISGNSQSHTVRLAYANGADVPGGSVSVNTAGAPAGQFKYAALASPVTLSPYTTYYIVSREFNGGDQWYSYDNVLTTTSAATLDTMAYAQVAAPNTFFIGSHPGGCWGPLSFRYETDWNLASETRYLYDGMLPIQERDGHNIPRVTYTRGLDLSGTLQSAGGIGGLLARTDHSSLTPYHSFYHADGSGNITALLNSQQYLVARYAYDPFGSLLAQSGPLADANTIRFSSKEHHVPSGLSYYGRRFYDPNLQRWLNPDPLGEAGGLNLYGMVANNPISILDPWGLNLEDVPGLGPNSTPGSSYAYSPDAQADHDRIMDDASETIKNAAKEIAKEFAWNCVPIGRLGKLAKKALDAAGDAFGWLRSLLAGAKAADNNIPANSIVGRTLGKLDLYPQVIDPRTGGHIPFPSDIGGVIPQAQRVPWGAKERGEFISEWYQRGYETPRGGWDNYDIHHIKPREFGGGNDFWNLAPVERGTHQNLFNNFWREFNGL